MTRALNPCPRCGQAPDRRPNWSEAKIGCTDCALSVSRPWSQAEPAYMTVIDVCEQWNALGRAPLSFVVLPSSLERLKALLTQGVIKEEPTKTLIQLLRHALGMDGDPIYSAQIRAVLRGQVHEQ